MTTRISIEEFEALGQREIPFVELLGYRVDQLDDGSASVRAPYDDRFLRPGGTISGPVLMGLADYAAYAAILSRIGNVPLAVTTNLNINFLRRPVPGDVIAMARVIKLGRQRDHQRESKIMTRPEFSDIEARVLAACDLYAELPSTVCVSDS